MIGTKLAHYEITSHLGTGGMGEVYQAIDSKLGRSVAIKLLPAAFASDPDRLSRFRLEAQVLASLNHSNIAQIYGIEESGDTRCIVMELVEGETLQARIQRGPLAVDQALTLAKQIAEALEAAHDKGVIHRDLKPGNVMLTPDGKVKVLDFGLAKAMSGANASAVARSHQGNDANHSIAVASNSPTLASMAATNAGVILGTAAYMSPEQAKGRAVDRRTDIFAFGCVLFEMLSGKRAFDGDDVTDILGAVLRMEPDWNQLPETVPAGVRHLLRLYLEKNAKNRRSDATDVRLDIDQALRALHEPVPVAQSRVEPVKRPLWKRAVPVVVALLLGGAIAGAAIWKLRPAAALPVTRFPVTLAEGQQFTAIARVIVAVSPDGSQLVYVANNRLYRRAMSELEARAIPGSEVWQFVGQPVFSPDGRSLAFWAASDRTLKKIAVSGGAAETLCPVETGLFGMSWGEDGIVFGHGNTGIFRVSEKGGKPELLVKAETGEFASSPQILPGGEALLYSISTSQDTWDKGQVFVQSLKPGSARTAIIQGTDGRYVSTGHIVYAFGGTLFAVPFDLRRLQVTGGQVPVVEGVRRAPNTGSAQFSFSSTGSLIYVPGPVSLAGGADRVLATIGRQSGQTGPGGLERLKAPPKAYAFPRVSPNGKRVAVSTDDSKETNVWIVDLAGATAPRQLTLGGANRFPVWSADEEYVAFQSDRDGDPGIFWQKANGTGTAVRLTKPEAGLSHIPDSSSPDGKWLAYTAVKGNESALWMLSLQDQKATVFAEKAGARIGRAAFSPDGHWLAYQSNETGPNQVFVQPFPATGTKYPVVAGGHPFWSPDGRELILNPGAGLIGTVSIMTGPTFSFGPLVQLPGGTSGLETKNPVTDPRVWDITHDGKRIIGVTNQADANSSSGTPAAPQIQVVLNWFEDLKQRMSAH